MKILLLLFLVLPRLAQAAASGGQADIQAAINASSNGGTVLVPAGRWTWTDTLTIKAPVTLQGESGTTIVNGRNQGPLIVVTPSTSGVITIKGLSIEQGNTTPDWSVKHLIVYHKDGAQSVVVSSCHFALASHGARMVEWETNGGLISHCDFTSTQRQDTSGIAFKAVGIPATWTAPSTIGAAGDPDGNKNTYLEDCTFKDVFLQALDFDDNSRTVVRHCTFDNSGTTSHGADTSPYGVRQIEFYDNQFIFTLGGNCTPNPYPLNLNYWFYVRGGVGVICDNLMPAISSCAWGNKPSVSLTVYNITRKGGQVPCQTNYPAFHQIGQGPEGTTDPLYIWGNTGSGATHIGLVQYSPDECNNNQQIGNYLKEGRDYVLDSRPNYQKYTYPHPLAAAGQPPKPTPTPGPSASPTPTPAPTPAPTATPPAPNKTYRIWFDSLGNWLEQHPATPDP
ncbi:MAG: hypothetical protein DMG76_23705 [Acidobacteria bacterium]|nr:MAG: hypothetical protein DMG76_23705 [Acidobacteriota bacterium]